jgi:hypothetical protein
MGRLRHREYITEVLKGTILITLGSLCFSCASLQDMDRKRESGDSIAVTYDYHWSKVWTAVSFVYLLSSDHFISVRRKNSHMRWYEKNPSNPQKCNETYNMPNQPTGTGAAETLMTIDDRNGGMDIAIFFIHWKGQRPELNS